MSNIWRRGCIPFILLATPVLAHGQGTQRGVDMFNQCAEITQDAERLACFDRVTREMRGQTQPAVTANAPRPATPAARADQQRADFGLSAERREQRAEARRPQRQRSIDRITARVAAVKRFGAGYWAILLEDGAIWESTQLNFQFRPPRAGENVRLSKGLMGGYLMRVGDQASMRVTRVS